MSDYLSLNFQITDAEIIEKLDILRLEKGISYQKLIIQSIAEKLHREGYLPGGYKEHVAKDRRHKINPLDQLRLSDYKRK